MNKAELIERLEWHARHERDCHRPKQGEGFQGAAQVVRNCLDGDPPVEVQRELATALRQHRHNDDSPGFVFAYETTRVDRLIERLTRKSTIPDTQAITINEAMDLIQHGAESIDAAYKKLRDET